MVNLRIQHNYNVLRIMSGMGGLASIFASAIKLFVKIITSGLFNHNLQHNLVVRETPKTYYTKFVYVNMQMAENKPSGMVKVNRMLQWAIRMLVISQELQRQRLNRCGWMIKHIICLRYSPFLVGNFKDIRQQLNCLYCEFYKFNHFLIIHSKNEYTTICNLNSHHNIETIYNLRLSLLFCKNVICLFLKHLMNLSLVGNYHTRR